MDDQKNGPSNNEEALIDEKNPIDSKPIVVESTTTKEHEENEEVEDNPVNWPKKRKWMILVVLSGGSIIAPVSTLIFYPAVLDVQRQLHTNNTLTNASVSIYLIFQGIGPLGWAAYSEARYTRRKVYIASLILFIITSMICAISSNIWLLIVMRSIQACGSNALHAIGPTTISDMFVTEERGNAFGFFYLFSLTGPLLGPAIGGYITEYLGWRWIFWFMAIAGFVILTLIFFFVPETYRKQKHIPQPVTSSSDPSKKRSINPFSPLILFRYPNLSIVISYISIFLSLTYTQGALIPTEFNKIYHLSASQIGLVYLSPAFGYMIGSVIGGRYADYVLRKARQSAWVAQREKIEKDISKGEILIESIKVEPEKRIHGIWLGAIVIPLSFVSFGWLLEYEVSIVYPIISMFFGGLGQLLAFTSSFTYLVDSSPTKSASVNADLTFSRQVIAGIVSLFSVPINNAVGVGWTFSFISFLYVFGTILVIIVLFKGKQWRLKFKQDFNIENL